MTGSPTSARKGGDAGGYVEARRRRERGGGAMRSLRPIGSEGSSSANPALSFGA